MKLRLFFLLFLLALFPLCAFVPSRNQNPPRKSHRPHLASVHIVDRNGFSETTSQPDRLRQYQKVDFLQPQPYQKVLRVYERNSKGEILSYLTAYHENGCPKQYLEIVNGRASGIYQEWHANGMPSLRTGILGGTPDLTLAAEETWVFDGVSQAWDDEGRLLAEIGYEKGELEGDSLYYHSNGKLWKRIPFQKNQIEGELEIFTEDGEILQRIPYKAGQKSGMALRFWPSGQLSSEELFFEGKLWHATYRDIHGNPLCSIEEGKGKRALFGKRSIAEMQEYESGVQQGEVQQFTASGELVSRYHTMNGIKHGEEIEYYPSSDPLRHRPRLSIMWYEGRIQGPAKTWYENGVLESQREMVQNQKNGLLSGWYRDGSLMLIEEYENDLLLRGEYYGKGEKNPASEVIAGSGTASLFDGEGNALRKIRYENGKPVDA